MSITEDLPRQVRNEDEFKVIQDTIDATVTVFTSQFVFAFIINLILNGIMSQLWNIFNTLQIILALPLLAVMMPGNV